MGAVIALRLQLRLRSLRRSVALDQLVTALIFGSVGPPNLRLEHDTIAAGAAEILERMPAFGRLVLLEELAVLLVEPLDDVRTDRVIEHRSCAYLHRSAAEHEVGERLLHVGNAAYSREALIRECLRELRHLREREWKDRGSAEPATRYVAVDVDLEIESLRIDERQRRKGVRRDDCIRASAETRTRLDDDVGSRWRELAPHRNVRDLLHSFSDSRAKDLVLADVGAHVLSVHVGTGEVELEPIRASVLTPLREQLPVAELLVVSGSGHD